MKTPNAWMQVVLSLTAAAFLQTAYADHHEEMETATTEAAMEEPAAAEAEATMSEADTMETGSAAIAKYTCSMEGLVRRIEIVYPDSTSKVPCDVNYYKDSEAPNEVVTLWRAQNLNGYCEEKANEFVEKLKSWGWSCQGE